MDTILRGHRGRRVVRLLPVILFAVFLGVVYVMMSSEPQRRGFRAAAESPPAAAPASNQTRAAEIYYQKQLSYDQAYTTCKELGLETLAIQLQTPAKPGAVAAAFARDELPAFRRSMRLGCQQALQGKPSAFRSTIDADRAAP